jgi:glycosyltransferase involved in cell wall biosynthesis
VIEAAACGIPSIGTNIYGLSDAIIDGETGFLVPVGSIIELEASILRLALDSERRKLMRNCSLERVQTHFRQEILVEALDKLYNCILIDPGAGTQKKCFP